MDPKQIHFDYAVFIRTRSVDAVEMRQHPRSPVATYEFTDEYDGQNHGQEFLHASGVFQSHPEAKSSGLMVSPAKSDTRGLLWI